MAMWPESQSRSDAVTVCGTLSSLNQPTVSPAATDNVAGSKREPAIVTDVPGGAVGTRQALANLLGVVEAAGAGAGDLVKVNVYLGDIADAATVNAI